MLNSTPPDTTTSACTGASVDTFITPAVGGAGVPVLAGEDLAKVVTSLSGQPHVLLVLNGFTACVYQRSGPDQVWSPLARGEIAEEFVVGSAKLRSQKRLWFARVGGAPELESPDALPIERLTTSELRRWLREAMDLTGREGEVSAKTREQVVYLAGWRCQFAGCGRDLHEHGPTGRTGRFSYFAHIVASSPKGPRGHATRSAELADEAENIMLLCDGCHRLVDRVDPGYYTERMLQQMRERSTSEVRRLLDTLQYPEAEVVAIIGSVSGQVPQFNLQEAEQALWQSHLRAARHRPEYLFHVDHQQHDVHAPDYWSAVFRSMRSDGLQLQRMLNGVQRGGAVRPRIAVFPLHSTSVLLVAGRVLGETSGTHLFQPHRSVAADPRTTRWAWPPLEGMHRSDKFLVRTLKAPGSSESAANLIVSLTFDLAAERLPPGCYDAHRGELALPTVEVYVAPEDRGIHVIGAPSDLECYAKALDRAIQILHDEWRVTHVHLFIGAPTTAVVTMGQKMQARYQATYVCHEAKERDGVFFPTVEISSTQVRELQSGMVLDLQP